MTNVTSKETAVEATGMVLDKLDQYMSAAQTVIAQYGGDAVSLGLSVLRIESAGELLTGLVGILIMYLAYKYRPKAGQVIPAHFVNSLVGKTYSQRSSYEDTVVGVVTGSRSKTIVDTVNEDVVIPYIDWDSPAVIIRAVLCGIIGAGGTVAAISHLANLWNWVGIFWPEAYAVHKFLIQ